MPRESACLGLPGVRENVVKLNADHRDVCKFGPGPVDQDNLKLVQSNIKDLYQKALKKTVQTDHPPRPSSVIQGSQASANNRHHIPFLENRKFVGRDAIIQALKQKLFTEQDCWNLAVVGLGGVGKTQVALQFAYWVKHSHPEYAILWVSALSRTSFEQGYLGIGKKLGVRMDREDPMRSVETYLSSGEAAKWLLVIDNADDQELLESVSNYLPKSEQGVTIFTTRLMDIAISVAGSDVIELHEMGERESEMFLETSLIPSRQYLVKDKVRTTELLEALARLPLAIAQAAAYLNRNRSSIQQYLKLLRGAEPELVGLLSREFPDNTRYRESRNAVATTWIVSFEQIRNADPSAAELLAYIACIEPKAIPRSLLPTFESEVQQEHAIGTLSAYAFLVSREEDDVYDMHNLVQLATWIWIRREGDLEKTLLTALRRTDEVLDALWPKSGRGLAPSDSIRQQWRAYLPHASRLLHRSEGCEVDARYDLFFSVGQCFSFNRQFKPAIDCLEKVTKWRADRLPEDDEGRLVVAHWLAGDYLEVRQVKDAIRILEHIVEVEKQTLEEESASRLKSEQVLASAYIYDERANDAIPILQHVVEVLEKEWTEEAGIRLTAEHELGRAYLADGRIRDAIRITEHVVKVRKHVLEKESYVLLVSQHQLARAYMEDGRLEEAVLALEGVQNIVERTLAEDDHTRLTVEHDLASAYLRSGRTENGILMLEHVVDVREKTLAKEDYYRLLSEHDLATAYLNDNPGRISEGIRILQTVVEVRHKILNEEDHVLLDSQLDLASAYVDDGPSRLTEAIRILEHVVGVRKRTLEEGDNNLLVAEHALADAYMKDAPPRVKDATRMLKHVVVVREQILDEEDPRRLIPEHKLAGAYMKDAPPLVGEAIRMLEHVVKVKQRTLTEQSPVRLASEHSLANAYLLAGDAQKAVDVLQHVVDVESQLFEEGDIARQASVDLLSRAYADLRLQSEP